MGISRRRIEFPFFFFLNIGTLLFLETEQPLLNGLLTHLQGPAGNMGMRGRFFCVYFTLGFQIRVCICNMYIHPSNPITQRSSLSYGFFAVKILRCTFHLSVVHARFLQQIEEILDYKSFLFLKFIFCKKITQFSVTCITIIG